MNRSGGSVGLIISLVGMFTNGGCASAPPRPPTPIQVIDLEPRVTLRPYTTLVVKDFQNAVGDALPQAVLQKLPEVVIAHLKECYPRAFARIERVASGAAEELLVEGTISGYEEGSRLRRFWIGGSPARVISTVSLADGQTNRKLTEIKVDFLLEPVSGVDFRDFPYRISPIKTSIGGAAIGVEDLVETAGVEIAVVLADKKGLFILRRQELTARRFEAGGSVPQGSMKAEQCYR